MIQRWKVLNFLRRLQAASYKIPHSAINKHFGYKAFPNNLSGYLAAINYNDGEAV